MYNTFSKLFEKGRTSIVRHINNIYQTSELERNSTCAIFAQVHIEGKSYVKA